LTTIFSVLIWLHIFTAVGWMGSAMVFGMIIGPLIPKLSPPTRGELIVNLFPKYIRYIQIFAGLTVVFGVALLGNIIQGDLGMMSPSTPFGLYISSGAGLALVTVILAFGFIVPATHKLVRLTQEAMKSPGPPSPELQRTANRLRAGTTVGLALLIVVLVLMVAAATT
jgi:uncharacterized membrane protein